MAILLIPAGNHGRRCGWRLLVENTATGSLTVLHHPITGYSEGQLSAMVAAFGSWLACWWSGR
jgi:hypothetical protein